MRAVVERFARAVKPAPMPVVMNEIVNEWTARSRTLPEIVIQPFGNRRWFTVADGHTMIRIPTFAKISFADEAIVNLRNDFAHVPGRTALRAHLHDALIFIHRL